MKMNDAITNTRAPGQTALTHMSALYGYAMTLTGDQREAEDLVQETYERATRSFDRLTPSSNLKGWLFTIMRDAWFNELCHIGSRTRFANAEGPDAAVAELGDAAGNDSHVIFICKITRDQVRAAIGGLPVHYREVVVLRDLEDFSYQEIATVLGCPVGTVMSRLGRAREKLRLLLDQWQGDARTRAKA
jgi:RNA polymerase sigma-70 factor (ECF subfamily)